MTLSDKDDILADLQILNDEPISVNLLFNFETFGNQISKLLIEKTIPTPFAIGLDGEWGSGKSTLLHYVENLIGEEITHDEEKKNWKIIYFNAWKYEKLDPIKSPMQIISTTYGNKNADWKEITKNYALVGLSTGLKVFFGINLRDELEAAKEYWSETVEKLKTISETLGDLIGEGRLIVFIDDLDRCSIDTALDTLLSIKVLFNSKNSIFLVAADFRMLSHAWELKYKSTMQ